MTNVPPPPRTPSTQGQNLQSATEGPTPGGGSARGGPARGRRRAAVIGSPIDHSLSPVLHRAAYAQLGLDWAYDAIEVDSAGLAEFLAGCGPEWAGLSLTMPLKRSVLPLLDDASELVGVVGGANTVVFTAEGLVGHNTDVVGIVGALRGIGAQPGPAMVLGGGATAASALAALAGLGCASAVVCARRPEAAVALLGVADDSDSGWTSRAGPTCSRPGMRRRSSCARHPPRRGRGSWALFPPSRGGCWMSPTHLGRRLWSRRGSRRAAGLLPATRCCCSRPSSRSDSCPGLIRTSRPCAPP